MLLHPAKNLRSDDYENFDGEDNSHCIWCMFAFHRCAEAFLANDWIVWQRQWCFYCDYYCHFGYGDQNGECFSTARMHTLDERTVAAYLRLGVDTD